jgi:hypothetical protein
VFSDDAPLLLQHALATAETEIPEVYTILLPRNMPKKSSSASSEVKGVEEELHLMFLSA